MNLEKPVLLLQMVRLVQRGQTATVWLQLPGAPDCYFFRDVTQEDRGECNKARRPGAAHASRLAVENNCDLDGKTSLARSRAKFSGWSIDVVASFSRPSPPIGCSHVICRKATTGLSLHPSFVFPFSSNSTSVLLFLRRLRRRLSKVLLVSR